MRDNCLKCQKRKRIKNIIVAVCIVISFIWTFKDDQRVPENLSQKKKNILWNLLK